MDYEVFKNVIATRIKEFLPPLYASFSIEIRRVPKINGIKEAMILEMEAENRRLTAPNIYLDDLYNDFQNNRDLEQILQETAVMIVNYTGTQLMKEDAVDMSAYKRDIVKTLINTERNRELLEGAPHRNFLDLSVIYRFAIEDEAGGYATALLTSDVQQELGLTEGELDSLAEDNSRRKLKTKVVSLAEDVSLMTTEYILYGAVNLLRTDEISKIADQMEDDLYLLPGSLHEIIVVKAGGRQADKLMDILRKGNSLNTMEDEFLSENIYFYNRKYGTVEIWNG